MDLRKILALFLFFILSGANTILIAQITPWEAISQMQKGINLGNTLEPPDEGYWPAGWNNPKAEEFYFDMYQQAGFDCVRIPVRWDEHTSDVSPYKIDEAWLQRVEEVLDWGLERDLFVIVNAHHDDWIKDSVQYKDPDHRARFDSIWSQISVRFKDKPQKLIFEVLNEPYGLKKEQNDDLHQRIISIIRKTNPSRLVIFQGHNWGGAEELVTAAIPDDDYVIGSFHAYTTYHFAQLGEGTWGTSYDINNLKSMFLNVKNWSDENNIPVLFGEFGAVKTCDYNSRMKNYFMNVVFAQNYGFAYCAWDNGLNGEYEILERDTRTWNEIKDILIHSSSRSPASPQLSLFQDTIIHLSWTNAIQDHDSIYIERRRSDNNYARIAALKGDTTGFYDINLPTNIYYHYRIIAHYNSGEDHYSYPVRIYLPVYVPKVRIAFLGEPAKIPGTVEAENFDYGGEGLTYHDADALNITGEYRPSEGVDIYDRNDDGYHIGNAIPGEWYEYTVDVEYDGEYDIDISLASLEGGGTFKLKIGDVESDTLTAPTSYSWLDTKIASTVMNLTAGEQIMRFTVIANPMFNIDKLVFKLEPVKADFPASQNMSFTVFQNQNRELVIDSHDNTSIKLIRMYSITGSLIYSKNDHGNNASIETSGIPSGTYIIQALTRERVYTRKVILK
jgi:aryl-phospho-beta-D-glucosidase BglC (GH1 family)